MMQDHMECFSFIGVVERQMSVSASFLGQLALKFDIRLKQLLWAILTSLLDARSVTCIVRHVQ